MKKRWLALLLVVAIALIFVACGSSQGATSSNNAKPQETPTPTSTEATKEPVQEESVSEVRAIPKTIDSVADALGLTEKSEVWFAMIGATDGAEFNGGSVELYIYDSQETAQYKGFAENKGMYGTAFVNDGVVLVFLDGVEPDQDIVELFTALVFEK